jgi:hypothetical protein
MRPIDLHEAWEMKPRKLTIEETENPQKVIDEFFQYASLPDVRWLLWEGTKTLVTGTFHQMKCRERCNLIYFYEQLEKLVEVNHVIYEKQKNMGL